MILKGMDCEKFVEKFAHARVSLEEFLTINDIRLEEIGIELPFHRQLIRLGILNFHRQRWSNASLYVPLELHEKLSSMDLTLMLANLLRQAVIIKSSLIFLKNLSSEVELQPFADYFSTDLFVTFQTNTKNLSSILKQEAKKQPLTRPLLITRKKKSNQKLMMAVKLSAVAAVAAVGVLKIMRLLRK